MQLLVVSVLAEQLVMRTAFNDFAIMQDANLIGILDG